MNGSMGMKSRMASIVSLAVGQAGGQAHASVDVDIDIDARSKRLLA